MQAAATDPAVPSLSRKQAAAYLTSKGYRVTPQTLSNMASNNNKGKGPTFTRFGWKTVRYSPHDLDTWLKKRTERVE